MHGLPNNLFSQIASVENLIAAWDEFKKGKREKFDVQLFEFQLEENLFKLHADLIRGTYEHDTYTAFYIHDPKVRRIHKASVRDRVVHHALFRIIGPIFEKRFIEHSYSGRLDKGHHLAVKYLRNCTRRTVQQYRRCFVLKCDVKRFFDTIDHEILLKIISNYIKDEQVLQLITEIVLSFSSTTHTHTRERERERDEGRSHWQSHFTAFCQYLFKRA